MENAARWIEHAAVGDPRIDPLVRKLAGLRTHSKWEVRRALAMVSASIRHPLLDDVLRALSGDQNRKVSDAAAKSAAKRKRWGTSDAFAKGREGQLDVVLDAVERRLGAQGRAAVKRAAEKMLDLGAQASHGFHGVSRLREQLAMAARGRDLVPAQGDGRYQLADGVRIGTCNCDALRAIENASITRRANEIQTHMAKPRP